jgi:hypothetical protein
MRDNVPKSYISCRTCIRVLAFLWTTLQVLIMFEHTYNNICLLSLMQFEYYVLIKMLFHYLIFLFMHCVRNEEIF